MTGKELLDKVYQVKGNPQKNIFEEKNKATIAGGVTGCLLGVYYGFSKKHNLLVTGAIGAIVGAVAVRLLMPKN